MTDLHVALTKQRRLVDPAAPKVARVYKITGPGGKLYFGKTVSTLKLRIGNHECAKGRFSTYLTHALRKHGRDAFTIEYVLIGTEAYCFEMEPKIIATYVTQRPHGYNVATGGEGFTSEEKKRWHKTPSGREQNVRNGIKAGEMSAARAGYPGRRVREVLENAQEWLR